MTTTSGVASRLAELLEFRMEALIQRWAGRVRERLRPGASHRAEPRVTQQIVLGHGGGIGVRSTLAEGPPFTLRLSWRPSTPST